MNFQAAEFLHDTIGPSCERYTILRKDPSRGWMAYLGKGKNRQLTINNNAIFGFNNRRTV
jgi:hypothetical protein